MKTISIHEFAKLFNKGEISSLIDVRTPAEYASSHLAGSINLPLEKLNSASLESKYLDNKPIYLICQSGTRSAMACQKLSGVCNSISIEGGISAAESAGLTIIRGSHNTISLERQVRITAGTLVLLGILLAKMFNPSWIYLSAFVGAGLVFAGITNTCGMAMLLARFPWNQQAKNE